MEKPNSITNQKKRTLILLGRLFLFISMLYGCAHQKPQPSVSQYRFILDDETYRIRSITSADKSESYNEVIGEKFMAVDYDQDGVLEGVVLGDVNLTEAQKIYDYGLNGVTKENKLQVRNPGINRYAREKDDVQFEIRSFQPVNATPFNEFKITDTRPLVRPEVIVLLDQNADGILDEVLKGSVRPDEFQSQYAEMIKTGLQSGDLIKVNRTILVKEK
jgi:hypothetical protein